MAGKTGTAQNSHGKDHGWFIGFAPADKPELIIGAHHGVRRARLQRGALRGADAPAPAAGAGHRGTIKIKALLDETVGPQDTAPRPVELNPDSAAARAVEDSIRRAAPHRHR